MASACAVGWCLFLLVLCRRELIIEGATLVSVASSSTDVRYQLGASFGGLLYVTGAVLKSAPFNGSPTKQDVGLAFVVPTQATCYLIKSKWRTTTATSYIAMQLKCSTPLSSTEDYYLDRQKLTFAPYPKNSSSTFGPVKTDARIFFSACCCCETDSLALNTIYWNNDNRTSVVLVAKTDRTLGFITVLTSGSGYKPTCSDSGLLLYASPSTSSYKESSGESTGSTGAGGSPGNRGAPGASGSPGSQSSCPRGPVKFPKAITSASIRFPVTKQLSMPHDPGYNVTTESPAAFQLSYYGGFFRHRSDSDHYHLAELQPFVAALPSPRIDVSGDSEGVSGVFDSSAVATADLGAQGENGAEGPRGRTGNGVCTASYTSKRRKRESEQPTNSTGSRGLAGVASTDVDLTSYLPGEPSSGLVQLSVYRGFSRTHVIGSETFRASLILRLHQFSKGCDSPDSVFKITRHNAYAISPDGLVTKVTAFTIEHVNTSTYVVADVLENSELNLMFGKSALLLKPKSDYDDVHEEPDYRYFVRYVTTLDDHSTVATYCSLFFRNYCIWPASTCSLSLMPVDSDLQSAAPSDGDPSEISIQNFYNDAKKMLKLSVYPKIKMDTVTVQFVRKNFRHAERKRRLSGRKKDL